MRRISLALVCVALGCAPASDRDAPLASGIIYQQSAPDFTEVHDVSVDGDVAWVLDRYPPFVSRVDLKSMTVTHRFGREGLGPGEFQRPVSLLATAEGLLIWDAGLRRTVLVDRMGAPLGSTSERPSAGGRVRPDIETVTHLRPWRVRELFDSLVYNRFPADLNHAQAFSSGKLVVGEVAFGDGRELVSLSGLAPTGPSATGQFAAVPLWDACADHLVTWDPRNAVFRSTASDREDRVVSVQANGPAISISDVENFARYMARLELGSSVDAAGIDFAAYARRSAEAFGRVATPFTDIRCGAQETVWLQRFDLTDDPVGRGRSWIRFDPRDTEPIEVRIEMTVHHFLSDGSVLGHLTQAEGDALALWREATPTS